MHVSMVRSVVLCLAVAVAAAACAEQHRESTRNQRYCNLYQGHTLCDQGSTRDTCGYVRRRQLSESEAKEILHLHNLHRQNVTWGRVQGASGYLPKAANMRQMTYDMELHAIAQGAADRCMRGNAPHDCGECRKTSRGGLGQNVAEHAVLWSRRPTLSELENAATSAVQQMGGWAKQNRLTSYNQVARCCHEGIGHYTQMIWAESHVLGCGYIEYGIRNGLRVRLYCNYGPGGNYRDQAVYKIGEPCSACPLGTRCSQEYSGLCV